MGDGLRVILPGPEGSGDARRAFTVMGQILELLGELEDKALNKQSGRADDRTSWGLTELSLGSIVTTLAPNMPRRGATSKTLSGVLASAVDGFAQAEEHEGLPEGWDIRSARTAADLTRLLGLISSDGMQIQLLRDDHPVRAVTVTHRSAENLSATLKTRRESIGSVIGRLDSLSLHDRREAGLWPERNGPRVAVRFEVGQVDELKAAWGRRVEVSGLIVRDIEDTVLTVRMRRIELLPDAADAPAVALSGLSLDMAGDRAPGEHLEDIRGAS
ncbi:hypothetical protein [Actinoplanes sp. M2I2]|uniref:hypothetical protein n=1 Tax=Actinoplanes sp. M2I2 TaxID=1734444 RepID=UPI00201FCB36|nr:hypothetical protein [Actinoplanes sp. M2I2]